MQPEAEPGTSRSGTIFAERSSLAIVTVAWLVIAAVGSSLYVANGSYFLDEAAVVESLDHLSALETFSGPLEGGGQNFPRAYLLAIRAVRSVFGTSTWATRLLPHVFFLLGTLLWIRLLYLRFRNRPLVLLLAVLLPAIASSLWLYSAVVKQYSLDVTLVLALFSVPDRSFRATFRGGRRLGGLAVWLVPILFSYTYSVALLARLAGAYVAGLREDGPRVDLQATALFAAGFTGLLGVLWFTDIRYTMGQQGLFALWQSCILCAGESSPASILERFFFGWYTQPSEFIRHPELHRWAIDGLRVALAVGVLRVVVSLVRPAPSSASAPASAWGSRSVGSLAGVCGAIATSVALDYPICAGRLVLYALFFQHVLILEGVDLAASFLGRAKALPWRLRQLVQVLAIAVFAASVFALASTAWGVVDRVVANAPLENLRPVLPALEDEPELPLVVMNCIRRQITALPEGTGEREVIFFRAYGWRDLVPTGQEVWLLHSRLMPYHCESALRDVRALAEPLRKVAAGPAGGREQVVLYRTRFLEPDEVKSKRRRVLREIHEDAQ